ncbi:MAG: MerR family transcriptional regulator [Gallionellaceae bacterium]
MTVSELARRAGVTADTVRHYTRSGLLVPTRDESNGYYYYDSGDLASLLFIRKARLLGFSVGDVRDILKESSHGHSPCPLVRKIMERRLQETRHRLQDMAKLQARMEHAAALWANMPDGMPDGNAVCILIEAIAMED